MDSKEKARQVLENIAEEFTCSGEIKAPFMGRTIEEIEKSKKFATNYICSEEAVLVAHRLKQAGFNPEIVYHRRRYITNHFFVLVPIEGTFYEIHLAKGTEFLLARKFKTTLKTSFVRIPFNLKPNQSLSDAMTGKMKILLLGKYIYPLHPRKWALGINKRRDVAKATRLNENLKKGLGRKPKV
ncbi:MAG: hypothetical protein WCW13_06770 [archaeon]|jgi:hypothetical protein